MAKIISSMVLIAVLVAICLTVVIVIVRIDRSKPQKKDTARIE